MKLPHAALLTGLTTALLFGTAPDVSAQLIVGVHGTLADVRSVTGGVGGRLGYVQPGGGNDVRFGIEAAYGIFFPSCIGAECDSTGGQIALLASRNFGSGAGAQSYLGFGARYQDIKLDDGVDSLEGDYWGFLILFGSSIRTDTAVSPFFELGWSFMNDIADIWDFTLGARFQVGG